MKTTEPKRILVFRTGYLGDTLVALPAFWAVRNRFPEAHITFLSNSDPGNPHYVSARNVLPQQGLFDSWITYPNPSKSLTSVREFWRLARELRSARYDALFYLMHSRRTPSQIRRDSLFFRIAGVRGIHCTGYAAANVILGAARPPLPIVQSECEFLLNGLRSEGIIGERETKPPEMALTEDECKAAELWLDAAVSDKISSKILVAVAPGSKWASKVWHEERFAVVVSRLIEIYGVFPIIFGGPEDGEKGERLLRRWRTGANAAGELNVREAAAALRRCTLFLGNDTGTMHLAASVGTPCVAVFSALDWPGRWYPYGNNHRVIRKSVECEGCRSPISFNGKLCLDMVSVDEVFDACREVLAERMGSSRSRPSRELISVT